MNDYYDAAPIDMSYYWQLLKTVFRKNLKKSLMMAAIIAALTFLYSLTLEPKYRATTVLHVAPKSSAVFNLRELLMERRDPAFRETQVGIIRSRVLFGKLVERLQLDKHPLFTAREVSVLAKIKQKLGLGRNESSEQNNKRAIASYLIDEVEIDSLRNSYLINISLALPDPQLAADITNAIAEEYIFSVQSSQKASFESSEKWLLDRLELVNSDLRAAEVALQEFKERENIIGSSKQNDGIVSQEVDMISGRLLEAKQKRLSTEALYKQIVDTERSNGDLQGISAIQSDALVQSIRKELGDLERRRGELSQRYGPEHRRMVELASQTAATNENLNRQIQRVVSTIKSEYELTKESEAFLSSSLGASTNKVQTLGRKQFDLLGLEQNVRTQRDVYQAFLKRLNENRATGVNDAGNVRITDPAQAPLKPLPSKATLLVLVVSILTALLGLGIGLLRELFDNTVNSDQDVDKKLSATSLGSVPLIDEVLPEGVAGNLAYNHFRKNNLSQFAESVRTVRSSLLLSSIDEAKRRILVTSTVPSEGKTSIAISLAFAFGQVQKTLLIDCDLRRPSLDELVPDAPFARRHLGLSDLCLGAASSSDCIHSLESSNVDILLAGTVNPNPQELFCSTKFSETLNNLSEHYDVIIIDSPPSGGLSDASLLATQVDQIAYVIKAGSTPVAKARSALEMLRAANAPLEGVVVNQIPATDATFSYYYGRGYYSDSVQEDA